jgi:hypothetical protein
VRFARQQATSFGSTAYVVLPCVATQVSRDFAELFEGGFEIFDDFLGEDIGIREIFGFFEAFVTQPEDPLLSRA